ncbi:hypothetical protein EVAR_59036_1 [Eumeta japonica]|uniref:Uncharacterized protein n=1 Tax=Eumeta variegata TaxID=151549 RepID=A0A4C1ZB41_EUMVA|nr:hypothetical protein EVAR_59036_1 [Eumeta japonica]
MNFIPKRRLSTVESKNAVTYRVNLHARRDRLPLSVGGARPRAEGAPRGSGLLYKNHNNVLTFPTHTDYGAENARLAGCGALQVAAPGPCLSL